MFSDVIFESIKEIAQHNSFENLLGVRTKRLVF